MFIVELPSANKLEGQSLYLINYILWHSAKFVVIGSQTAPDLLSRVSLEQF